MSGPLAASGGFSETHRVASIVYSSLMADMSVQGMNKGSRPPPNPLPATKALV